MQYKLALKSLKTHLQAALSIVVPAAPEVSDSYPASSDADPSTGTNQGSGGRGSGSSALTSGGGIMDISVLGIPVVVIAPVVLALGVGGYMVLKPRRAPAVAGYRRLRRGR